MGVAGRRQFRLELYSMLHEFNISSISQVTQQRVRGKNLSGWVLFMDFATRQEAELALAFSGTLLVGQKVIIAPSKIPLRYTVSWDSGRPSGHNKSRRDTGSAVGTNFEAAQEEILRKWILGDQDRKVGWVFPT
jgi:hypothetical protein